MKNTWSKFEINLYTKYNYFDYYANKYKEILKGYVEETREIWV